MIGLMDVDGTGTFWILGLDISRLFLIQSFLSRNLARFFFGFSGDLIIANGIMYPV